jgi:two-component system, OmpR family, response regulator
MQHKILVVDDETDVIDMLVVNLRGAGFQVSTAEDGAAALAKARNDSPSLIVLDLMLPGMSGLEICKVLKGDAATRHIPVIMLTAKGEEVDKVVGLELGADDYVTKPFSSRELIARIRALLRRSQTGQPRTVQTTAFYFANWRLEPASRQLFNPDGVRIAVTSTEFDLLVAFCQNPGRVLSRDQLLELTHSGLAGPIARSIDVHVSRIRQKIEPKGQDATYIKTVRLGGYIFTPSVTAS